MKRAMFNLLINKKMIKGELHHTYKKQYKIN